jgi:hypothetical protein
LHAALLIVRRRRRRMRECRSAWINAATYGVTA